MSRLKNVDLTRLSTLEPGSMEWEAERARLVRRMLDEVPKELRPKLLALQYELDLHLDGLKSRLTESIANFEDQLQFIKNTQES